MKVGIYYAYWTHDWDADFIPYIEKAAKLGFDILEINAGTIAELSDSECETLRQAAQEKGIILQCCYGLPNDSDISSAEETVRGHGIQHLSRIGEAMVKCGIKILSGIIYCSWPGSFEDRGVTKRQAWDWSVSSMKEVMKTVESFGLQYNIEVINRFEGFLLNTCEEAVRYVGDVGSPNLKILLDTFHMNIEEDSMYDAILSAGANLGQLHIGENNRKPPGYGHIPWEEVAKALKKLDSDIPVVMEPFLMPGGEVGRDIKVYRDLMPGADLDREAEKACSFMRGLLK